MSSIIKNIVVHNDDIFWYNTKPNGTPNKLMDSSKLKALGWKPENFLKEGISKTYQWYLENYPNSKLKTIN